MFRILRNCLIGFIVAVPLLFAVPGLKQADAQVWQYRYPAYNYGVPYYYNYTYRPYWTSPYGYYGGVYVEPYGVYYGPYSGVYYWR